VAATLTPQTTALRTFTAKSATETMRSRTIHYLARRRAGAPWKSR
jgi:hypothetical protein